MTVSAVPYSIDETPAGDASPERELWGAVLMRGIEDAIGSVTALSGNSGTHKNAEILRAQQWIGSKDFHLVATLAGLDSEALHDRLLPVFDLPERKRVAWWRKQMAESCGAYRHYTGTCRAPGCRGPVSRHSKTGLCREHVHQKGLCECGDCRRYKGGKWGVKA